MTRGDVFFFFFGSFNFLSVVFPDEERAADVRTRGAVVEHPSLSGRTPNGLWEYRILVRSERYRFASGGFSV